MSADFISFLLKATAIQFCFTIVYTIVFRSNTFHSLNRLFLILAIASSFVIPLLSLPAENGLSTTIQLEPVTKGFFVEQMVMIEKTPGDSESGISLVFALLVIYASGLIFMIVRTINGILLSLHILRRAKKLGADGFDIRASTFPHAFSFMGTIHLPENAADESILLHEKAHVLQKHWIDLIVAEVNVALLWFNPIAWIIRQEIRMQHEFLADSYAISNGISLPAYLQCLYDAVSKSSPSLPIHKFNSQSIKRRIIMMTNEKSSPRSGYLYLLIIPVVLLSLGFARRADTVPSITNRTIVVDPAHGGDDAGSSAGELSEKNIALSLAILVRDIAEQKGIKVILTRNEDQSKALADRVQFVKETKADAFVSLHVGFNEDKSVSGIDCFVNDHQNSKKLGSALVGSLRAISDVPVKGIHHSQAYVLKHNNVPAVILELGYLSNSHDAKFLSSDANLKQIAERIVEGIAAFN